jgi:hypothetical protein
LPGIFLLFLVYQFIHHKKIFTGKSATNPNITANECLGQQGGAHRSRRDIIWTGLSFRESGFRNHLFKKIKEVIRDG